MSQAAPIGTPAPARLDSVDLLRGLVMVVMALDHTRDYFHFNAIHGVAPEDLARTTPAIFFTRWITHFCAPVFSFLAGTGVYFSVLRGKSKRAVSWFLVTRGLWLILLELTYFNWAWNFSFDPHDSVGIVIWALGWSMIVLAGLIHLPTWAVAAFGSVMILAHNAFDGISPESWGAWAWLWNVLHVPGKFPVGAHFTFGAYYPLVPWVGVMAAGYGFGALFRVEQAVRQKWLLGLGLGLTAAFVLLRWSNAYGDRRPWSGQTDPVFTLLSFLNCVKYPPSLCYLLMTLGPAGLLLAWFDRGTPALLRPLLVFGRVPMFYYIIHIPLIHGLAWCWFTMHHGRADFLLDGPGRPPVDAGFNLGAVYLLWLAVVVALYPACRWFSELKRRRRDLTWLSYF